jgi:hypothetical protein
MTVTVFTTVLGADTDPLRPPTRVHPAVRYVCFTDHLTQPVPPYVLVREAVTTTGPYAAAWHSRALKILATHPALGSPDVVLWHDAAFQLDCDPIAVARHLTPDLDMIAFRHPHRDTIEAEAVAIARLGYVPADTLQQQIAAYRTAGFTGQSVITSTGFSLRRVTPAVTVFNARWWQEVATWGWRDQMSVDYAIWTTGLRVAYLPGHYRENPYARWHPAPPVRPPIDRRMRPVGRAS